MFEQVDEAMDGVAGGVLSCRRSLLTPLTGNESESKAPMVLPVRPTPTNVLYAPINNALLHSIPSA